MFGGSLGFVPRFPFAFAGDSSKRAVLYLLVGFLLAVSGGFSYMR